MPPLTPASRADRKKHADILRLILEQVAYITDKVANEHVGIPETDDANDLWRVSDTMVQEADRFLRALDRYVDHRAELIAEQQNDEIIFDDPNEEHRLGVHELLGRPH